MTIEEMKKLNPSELLKVRMEEWKKTENYKEAIEFLKELTDE